LISIFEGVSNIKQAFEDTDPFDSVSDQDLESRGVDPVASAYTTWGIDRGLRRQVAEVFGTFMKSTWGGSHLNSGYGEEWIERFRSGGAFAKADLQGQRLLKSLGVKKGVDARGYIVDFYAVEEASKYRIQQDIRKNIDRSPDELPYTYEDITRLPEYQAIVDLPYVTDVTSDLQKRRRAVAFQLDGRQINEERDPFDSVSPENLRMRKKEENKADKIRRRENAIKFADRRLQRGLEPKKYILYANGYVRYAYEGAWGGREKTGVLTYFDPALHIDDYRRMLVRIKKTLDRKANSIRNLKKNHKEFLATQSVTEAEERDPFDSVTPEQIKGRKDAYLKAIRAESGAWDDIAKAELEQKLECETEFYSDNGRNYVTLQCINGTEGNNGESEWIVYEDDSYAESDAVDQVQDMIESDPDSFSLESYMSMSDMDRQMLAQEEADYMVQDLSDDDVLEKADMEGEHEELQDTIDELLDMEAEELPDDWRGQVQECEDEKVNIVDRAREEAAEKIYDDIYDSLVDPIEYFVHERGIYSTGDLVKASFITIDYEEAAQDFVNDTGAARWIDSYDEEEVDLPSGAIAYGRN